MRDAVYAGFCIGAGDGEGAVVGRVGVTRDSNQPAGRKAKRGPGGAGVGQGHRIAGSVRRECNGRLHRAMHRADGVVHGRVKTVIHVGENQIKVRFYSAHFLQLFDPEFLKTRRQINTIVKKGTQLFRIRWSSTKKLRRVETVAEGLLQRPLDAVVVDDAPDGREDVTALAADAPFFSSLLGPADSET